MTHPLDPFDAVLVVSFGGPDGPDDVMPFLRNVAAGRNIPEERLQEVATHYYAIGGVSPINPNTEEFVDAVRAGLRERGVDVPVVLGCRNWHPFIVDSLRQLAAHGARRVLCLLTSAYSSYSGCRQYRENLAGALAQLAEEGHHLELAKIASYHQSAGWVQAQVDALAPALTGDVATKVLFVTHSIPSVMEELSGSAEDDPRRTYVAQHRLTAELVVARLGREIDWEIAFCSRSGPPQVPWLEPDAADRIRQLPETDPQVRRVVVVPFGFLNDHMEVRNDLDGDAAAAAQEVGLDFERVATAHVEPEFIGSLVDRLLARAAEERGEPFALDSLAPEWPTTCRPDCCQLRPGAAAIPAACQETR